MRDSDLVWMFFVDGCSVLQIMDKVNHSRFKDLKVKVDIQLILRDLFLLENQLPYEVLKLLSQDDSELKISMYKFCELQKTFTAHSMLCTEPEKQKEQLKKSLPPTHLLDCLHTCILGSEMKSTDKNECQINVHQLEENIRTNHNIPEDAYSDLDGRQINSANVATANANKKEKYISYRNIQELKTAGIQVNRQKNISLKKISFSPSLFGGKLHLPPLILENSTVTILLNLIAYEMCPDFENDFGICSYVKLLGLLIDNWEDVKELRSSGILHNSLGSDKEVLELFNTVGSGLLHDQNLYSEIKEVMEKQSKKKCSIWMAEAYYTYFKSPWTIIASLAALIALVLTALQTWLGFKS